MEDDLQWKMTFDGRQLIWKTTFDGRLHFMGDKLKNQDDLKQEGNMKNEDNL